MLKFTEEMKIGVAHIDAQHRELVDLVQKASALGVTNPSREEMKKCLDFLGGYVVKHFGDEEKLQIQSKYTGYERHRKIHQEFVDTFKSLYADFQENGPSARLSFALTNTISNWVIMHIKREDVAFGRHYAQAAGL